MIDDNLMTTYFINFQQIKSFCHQVIKNKLKFKSYRIMTCNEAKKISLVSVLDKIGAKKAKQNNHEVWYISPFRNESTASFKIDIDKNIWFDHGAGKGGNVLDFIMRYYNCDLKEALQILDNESFSFHQPIFQDVAIEKERNYEIRAIKPLTNTQLIKYIQNRCISLKIAKKYCVEVYYSLNNKSYYGIGFKNDSEGYEIRNKYIKMCLGTKAPSFFNNNRSQIILFESWSDFLSFLTLYPKAERHYDYLILNSVGTLHNVLIKESNNYLYQCTNVQNDHCINVQLDKSIKEQNDKCIKNTLYKQLKYETIICCFDNDDAGNKTTEKVQNAFPTRVKDGRYLYPNYKDLNDCISTN
ncbi:toprim domain-containing protein [Myroides odoratimimus]|uniref:toprim domain-containing protein n=1 Tax=Myroides odoratimimus TaxID=76832 RepID=UPI002578D63E|nr:toprim domain-containing protein [Myroides odoratimimus]MDM1456692.1 toprim domain-containing protein [Myroides odoratimimus]